MKKEKVSALVGMIVLIASFVLVSYFIQSNSEYIQEFINNTKVRDFAAVFVLMLIVATVFAPVSLLPIIPLASYAYGWFQTGILIVIGEFIGSLIAFALARKFGFPLVKKLISLEEIERYGKMLPESNLFWMIVFLRMAIPGDILSYVLGLFSKIKFRTYFFATLIGIIPGAFALAYVGSLELKYQFLALIMAGIVLLIGYGIDSRYRRKPAVKVPEVAKVVKKMKNI